jgi:cytochrome c oxidase subunit 2
MPALLLLLVACGAKPDSLQLEVVGSDYQWLIRYPGADGRLHSADDCVVRRNMVVPAHTDLAITMTSEDFLYTFRVVELDQKQMAVPDLDFTLNFNTGPPGRYQLKGDQMCGFAHESLIGDFRVVPWRAYRAWLAQQKRALQE